MNGRRLLAAGAAVALAPQVLRRLRRAEDLAGKVVLITGGSRGLGFALAERFAAEGARLSICARGEEALERARAKLSDRAEVHAQRCDVSDRAQVDAWVAASLERYGRVDVLVCNAGVIATGPFSAMRLEDFEEAMAIMFWGTVHATLAVLPHMRERGEGTIANVTSIGGKVAVPHLSSYTPAKYAAVGFSQALNAELAPHGIRVVTVVPGLMRTGSYLAAFYKGRQALQYAIFSPVSSTPGLTVPADRAARRIVEAVRRGEPEVTLGLHAKLLARANGLAPGLTAEALGLVARVLPDVDGPTDKVRGDEIDSPVDDSALTALGREAAAEFNQQPTR
jgi:NAD(P)-dependent dehydrogenase (short-subunit alcohol dehydrogenase family)